MSAPGTYDNAPSAPWAARADGVLTELAEIAGVPARQTVPAAPDPAEDPAPARVRYVEDKRIDWQRVREITALSEEARQWANFGPVSRALERVLQHLMRLTADRSVVMCASATVGLHALAALHTGKLGRRLRWVVSAYTFFSQRTGPFADAVLVDCDDRGLIDLGAVAALPESAWDGLVATNLFAGMRDARPFADFCEARGKPLILDSAIALFGPDRGWPGHPPEAISFHHTKPWGVGEGGCMIVDRADEALARSVLNFGVGGPDILKTLSGNGKISDVACAPILERLERMPHWAPSYQAQRRRIEGLCAEAGIPLLLQAPSEAVVPSVPVLAARPVERREMAQYGFDVGKYYPPLDGFGPTARRIFAHVANLPSHGGMAAIESSRISVLLQTLRQPAGETVAKATA